MGITAFSSCSSKGYFFAFAQIPKQITLTGTTIKVNGGVPPFNWSIDNNNFILDNSSTQLGENVITASEFIQGDIVNITVEDSCGTIISACGKICYTKNCVANPCTDPLPDDPDIDPEPPPVGSCDNLTINKTCYENELCEGTAVYLVTGCVDVTSFDLFEKRSSALTWTFVKKVGRTFEWYCKPRHCEQTQIRIYTPVDSGTYSNTLTLDKSCDCDSSAISSDSISLACAECTTIHKTIGACCKDGVSDILIDETPLTELSNVDVEYCAPEEPCEQGSEEVSLTCCAKSVTISWESSCENPPEIVMDSNNVYELDTVLLPNVTIEFSGGTFPIYAELLHTDAFSFLEESLSQGIVLTQNTFNVYTQTGSDCSGELLLTDACGQTAKAQLILLDKSSWTGLSAPQAEFSGAFIFRFKDNANDFSETGILDPDSNSYTTNCNIFTLNSWQRTETGLYKFKQFYYDYASDGGCYGNTPDPDGDICDCAMGSCVGNPRCFSMFYGFPGMARDELGPPCELCAGYPLPYLHEEQHTCGSPGCSSIGPSPLTPYFPAASGLSMYSLTCI